MSMTMVIDEQVLIGPHALAGGLFVPAAARGIVLFAHGSGSSRYSTRNRFVAEALQTQRLGTLLFDLLTDAEGHDAANTFDIGLLAGRLLQAIEWTHRRQDLSGLPLGLFGASTGAAAALVAAAERPDQVSAVVSRGGRPDLAGTAALEQVRAPTLLIVGARDVDVLDLNRTALGRLRCEKQLEVVPRATHLFEEAGTLQRVAALAGEWFDRHLGSTS
jgi:putative phosphoribosyl transferase